MSDELYDQFDPSRDVIIGEADGKVKLVWYISFTDVSSRRFRDILLRLADRFGAQNTSLAIRFLPAKDNGSELAARAAIAAHEQGQYLEMHRALFENPASYNPACIAKIANALGLDIQRFDKKMNAEETTERLAEDHASATKSYQPQAPLLFIDNRLYEGTWDETALIEAIEQPLGVRLRLASADFFHWAASAGLVLVLATLSALVFANIGFFEAYERLRATSAGLFLGNMRFSLSLEEWINDGLMAIFFLMVGIEIKREMVSGELSDLSSAALPIIGAMGGMVVPALIYLLFNFGQPTVSGWGIPMATDIAFTLGIMALLGRRVPISLKVFVSALAITDDLGAIVVIAVFYGQGFHMEPFIAGLVILLIMLGLNRGRFYSRTPYLLLGAVLWFLVHESGLHATLAGVLTALAIPSRPSASVEGVAAHTAAVFQAETKTTSTAVSAANLSRLQTAIDRLREPGYHLQHALESWSSYLILPLFAFFSTGILIVGTSFAVTSPEALGVMAGLVIGKPLGILLFTALAVHFGLAKLSAEISWLQMLGAGCLAGVGFTMSIFIGSAAFMGSQLEAVKLAIIIGSVISAILGVIILFAAANRDGFERQ